MYIVDNKLITVTHNRDYESELTDTPVGKPTNKKYKIIENSLEIKVIDRYEMRNIPLGYGEMGDEELPIPNSDAKVATYKMSDQRLSPKILKGIHRYQATHQEHGSPEMPYGNWQTAISSIFSDLNLDLGK